MPITFSDSASTPTNYNNLNNTFGSSGPLASLYSSGYTPAILQYPSDLGSAQKGHMVVFTALETVPAGYDQNNSFSLSDAAKAAGSRIAAENFNDAGNVDQVTDLSFQPKRTKSKDVISLYMPDTINFQYQSSYTEVSLKDAAEEAAGALPSVLGSIGKAVTSVVDSKATKLALNSAGYAINPQQQLLFDGIDFRSYQMSFQFTPKNAAESTLVKNIIQTFRSHAAPLIKTGAAGMAFIVPDSFAIQFIQIDNANGQNPFVTKLKESVLTNVDVNYAPNGIWSTHADGSPTQINMTLQFKEIALVDRGAIQAGF